LVTNFGDTYFSGCDAALTVFSSLLVMF